MLELTRADHKRVIQQLPNSWMVSDTNNVIVEDDDFEDNLMELMPEIFVCYKIRAHELLSIFVDTSIREDDGHYIYVFITDQEKDYSNWGFHPMSAIILNTIYYYEVENYKNSEQLMYKCSDKYINAQVYLESTGQFNSIFELVQSYYVSLIREMSADDFSVITEVSEEIHIPIDEEVNIGKSTDHGVIRSAYEVALYGDWLDYIGH